MLADTSVWIDALNGKKNWQADRLNYLINQNVIVLCPTIIQEILQGIRQDTDYGQVKNNLSGFTVLDISPVDAAYGAAAIYRHIRKQGITIRKSNDCLIAYYAIFCGAALLHNDADFEKIIRYTNLEVINET